MDRASWRIELLPAQPGQPNAPPSIFMRHEAWHKWRSVILARGPGCADFRTAETLPCRVAMLVVAPPATHSWPKHLVHWQHTTTLIVAIAMRRRAASAAFRGCVFCGSRIASATASAFTLMLFSWPREPPALPGLGRGGDSSRRPHLSMTPRSDADPMTPRARSTDSMLTLVEALSLWRICGLRGFGGSFPLLKPHHLPPRYGFGLLQPGMMNGLVMKRELRDGA